MPSGKECIRHRDGQRWFSTIYAKQHHILCLLLPLIHPSSYSFHLIPMVSPFVAKMTVISYPEYYIKAYVDSIPSVTIMPCLYSMPGSFFLMARAGTAYRHLFQSEENNLFVMYGTND